MKFVGYITGTCDGVEVSKPLVVECDDIHVHVQAGEVDILSLDPAHITFVEGFYGQVTTSARTRRQRLTDRILANLPSLDTRTNLGLGLLAVPLFLIGF